MAGGVGSRFWPFSKNSKPKQFLDFFGTGRSLLQMTFDRFNSIVPTSNILIVSNELYKNTILEQLPELKPEQVLLEPMRRNTAPCIAYAVHRISSMTNTANIIVTPADHLILREDKFIKTLKKGIEFIQENDSLLTLGIKPTRPETGYGYIQVEGGDNSEIKSVKTFTEKPNAELAQVFFETQEFFWNSGIFLWNLQTIENAFNVYLPEIAIPFNAGKGVYGTPKEKEFIEKLYPSCANISIDYGVMEKADQVYMLAGDFGWSDLGTWGALYDLSPKDETRNVTLKCESLLYESKNNIVALPKGKLAVIQGLEDYIVAESDEVLLICKKDEEQRIRQFVNDATVKFDGKYS